MGRIALGGEWWIEPYEYGWEIYRELTSKKGKTYKIGVAWYGRIENALRWVYEDRLRQHIQNADDPTLEDLYKGITSAMGVSLRLLEELGKAEKL